MKTETKQKNPHARYYALMRQLGATKEDQEIIIDEISMGQTKSIAELHKKFPRHYEVLLENLQQMVDKCPEQKSGEAHKWRRRAIAAISAWMDATGVVPQVDRMEYIKGIACRTVGKESGYFNRLTIPQLRTAYNSFIKQKQAYEKASGMNDLFSTKRN